ncbi:MAG: adenylyl-sulfate kinase [Sphingobacteriales bacterium]|nr:MAG: adenylyl-sulfate kinase [Sphingobacteriales bacterium]
MSSILLFTGLSGSGKTTLANAVSLKLEAEGHAVIIIDGDIYRNTISKDLGFSEEDRRENMRRLMEVALQKRQLGHTVLVSAINPFEDQRLLLAEKTGAYIVYIECPLRVVTKRDTKGLYKRAMLPQDHPEKLHNLTGVNDRYDVPAQPDLTINSDELGIPEAVEKLMQFIRRHST